MTFESSWYDPDREERRRVTGPVVIEVLSLAKYMTHRCVPRFIRDRLSNALEEFWSSAVECAVKHSLEILRAEMKEGRDGKEG